MGGSSETPDCSNCRFWKAKEQAGDKVKGLCRERPPRTQSHLFFVQGLSGQQEPRFLYATAWSETYNVDWCGKHEPAPMVIALQ